MGPVVAGPYEYVGRSLREISIVLAVDEQEVNPNRRRSPLQDIRDAEKQGNSRTTIVGAHDGVTGVFRNWTIRYRSAVPMGEKQKPLACARVEASDEVAKRKGIVSGGDVIPTLNYDRVGTLVQHAVEPGGHLVVGAGARDPGSKRNLLLDVLECGLSVKLARRPGSLSTREDGDEEEGREGG
jgi:hypothetical protein